MAGEIDINTVARAYARWAPIYDFVFGAVFDAGRKASIAAAESIGGRVLDCGGGTRTSPPAFAPAAPPGGGRLLRTDAAQGARACRPPQARPCRCAGGDGCA